MPTFFDSLKIYNVSLAQFKYSVFLHSNYCLMLCVYIIMPEKNDGFTNTKKVVNLFCLIYYFNNKSLYCDMHWKTWIGGICNHIDVSYVC